MGRLDEMADVHSLDASARRHEMWPAGPTHLIWLDGQESEPDPGGGEGEGGGLAAEVVGGGGEGEGGGGDMVGGTAIGAVEPQMIHPPFVTLLSARHVIC